MIVLGMLLASAVFGAGDQYLGSFSAHPWMADVSLLSAPWLVIAFLAGWTQRDPKRAVAMGFACTFAALFGYLCMTFTPVENAHPSVAGVIGFLRSSAPVFLGGLFSGPVFGWLGQQWRVRRATWAAAVTALTLCLEPLARVPAHRPINSHVVLTCEVVVGAVTLVVATAVAQRARQPH